MGNATSAVSVGRALVEQIVWDHVRPLGVVDPYPKTVVWAGDKVTFYANYPTVDDLRENVEQTLADYFRG